MKRLALVVILLASPAAADDQSPSMGMRVVNDVTAILNGMAETPAGAAEVHEILRPRTTVTVLQ